MSSEAKVEPLDQEPQAPFPTGQPGYQAAPPPYTAAAGSNPYPPQAPYGAPGSVPPGPNAALNVQPMPQPAAVTTAMTTTMVVQGFGDFPVTTTCPNCRNQVTTRVTHEPGSQAWLFCLLMSFFCLWCFALIPFCVESMQNAYHNCPVCNYRIGMVCR